MNKIAYLKDLPVGSEVIGIVTRSVFEKLEDGERMKVKVLIPKNKNYEKDMVLTLEYYMLTTPEWKLIEAL